MNKTSFDFEKALKQLQSGQPLTGAQGILTPLIKQLTEAALNAELEVYLEQAPEHSTRRNGYTSKTIKSATATLNSTRRVIEVESLNPICSRRTKQNPQKKSTIKYSPFMR